MFDTTDSLATGPPDRPETRDRRAPGHNRCITRLVRASPQLVAGLSSPKPSRRRVKTPPPEPRRTAVGALPACTGGRCGLATCSSPHVGRALSARRRSAAVGATVGTLSAAASGRELHPIAPIGPRRDVLPAAGGVTGRARDVPMGG